MQKLFFGQGVLKKIKMKPVNNLNPRSPYPLRGGGGTRRATFAKIISISSVLLLLISDCASVGANNGNDEGSDCFVKWVHGYRLASGRPQKILHSVSLEVCKQECASTVGCAAFAFGQTPRPQNSTTLSTQSTICELAINSRLRSSSMSSISSSRYPNIPHNSPQQHQQQRSFPPFPPPPEQSNNYRFFRDGRSVSGDNKDGKDTNSTGAPTITIQDLDRNPTYDVYIENPNSDDPCFKRDALYDRDYPPAHNQIVGGGGVGSYYPPSSSVGHLNGVPIDCFYRLMSGKRLVKTHTLRAISVNSLQECQEACIHERSFNCRSISYRYMPSTGYSYPVSNCEMSSYYMQSGTISSSYSKLDFVEDYDYDYFQRESHCKTTSSTGLGVCAVVVRRGGRVSTTLIKSSHHTVTSSQCEHLCATSLFRCRAFAFRHTSRGRDPFAPSPSSYPSSSPPLISSSLNPTRDLPPPADHTCLLYDTDLMRLPSYNIEPDQDFDLFEMGRLMGAECILYEQFLNRRPGYYSPGPVTSTPMYPPPPSNVAENRDYHHHRDYYGDNNNNNRGYYDYHNRGQNRNNNQGGMMMGSGGDRDRVDQHPHGTGMNYLINREHDNRRGGGSGSSSSGMIHHHHSPPSTLETGLMVGGGSASSGSSYNRFDNGNGNRPMEREQQQPGAVTRPQMMETFSNGTSGGGGSGDQRQKQQPPFYDKGKESCLRLYRQDSYLLPEVSRATFPVKTLDECRIECIRSIEVLRFPCRAMAFRHTSHSTSSSSLDRVPGGTCQLSDHDPREPDLIQSRDRYEGAVTFLYDDREAGCARGAVGDSYYNNDRGRYPGYNDYYNGQNRNNNGYNPQPPYASNSRYDDHRYAHSNYPSNNYNQPPANRYYDQSYDRRWSTSSSAAPPPPNYNPHYWDYHNRYGGSGGGGGGKYYGNTASGSNYLNSEYPSGQGGTTVNGERCMRGCRVNRDAGFYYCQIDEQGAWDFCCRPDHFCGYSKGLSVPWCYVGTGPSQNIWRSCEAKGTRNNAFFTTQPNVAYLHDRLPPTVYSLTSTQVANLTKDNAIRLFTNNTIEEIGGPGEEGSGNSNVEFIAKPIHSGGGSQEVIVRVSNSSSVSLGEDSSSSNKVKKASNESGGGGVKDGKKKS